LEIYLAGAATTTLTVGLSTNLSTMPFFPITSGPGAAAYLYNRGLGYNGTNASTLSLTGASYWNGNAWVAEPSLTTIPARWYVYFHLATYTTPSTFDVRLLPLPLSSVERRGKACVLAPPQERT
jgi:hypothetical protein